jgi:hypothetical protein
MYDIGSHSNDVIICGLFNANSHITCPPIEWNSWSNVVLGQEEGSIYWICIQWIFQPKGQTIHRIFMATMLNTLDTTYNVASSVGCNLHEIYGHMTPVEMHLPRNQSILDTTNQFPSTWPFLRGGQTHSQLQLCGTKDFYKATNPLWP